MFTISTNTPIKSSDISIRGGDPNIGVSESGIPIQCKGLASDNDGNIWVHNSNSGKLMKYNRVTLTPIVEFEGSTDIHIRKFKPYVHTS